MENLLSEECEHNEAFEHYFSLRHLGTERERFNQVAKIIEKSVTTIQKWSIGEQWNKRVEYKLNKMLNTIDKEIEHRVTEDVKNIQAMLMAGLDEFKKKVDSGEIKITSFKEANDCINAYTKISSLIQDNSKVKNPVSIYIVTGVPRPDGNTRTIIDIPSKPIALGESSG